MTMHIKTMATIIILVFISLSFTEGQEKNEALLYIYADKLPHFGKTDDQLFQYIYNNFEWPKNFDGDGRIIVSFIITKKGFVESVRIEKTICDECGQRIKKIIQKMPLWNPGEKDGNPIDIKIFLPIDISLK